MRLSSEVDQAERAPSRDHLCCVYDRHDDFVGQAVEFLNEGLAAGQRVCYVGSDDTDVLTGRLRGVGPGAVQVTSFDTLFPRATAFDPVTWVEVHAEATRRALADGFTGLRMAGRGTDMVRTAAQVDAVARYEHLVDRYAADQPFSAMCAYDGRELDEDVTERLACLHPRSTRDASPFHLHAGALGAGVVALRGEVDTEATNLLLWALERARPQAVAGELVIDATELDFINHHGLVALDDYAGRAGLTAVLHTPLPTPHKIVEILELRHVRVERVA